jgi:hypothetical protein
VLVITTKALIKRGLRLAGLEPIRPTKLEKLARYHQDAAAASLHNAQTQLGAVSDATLRLCEEYAVAVLGDKVYAPWLKVYATVCGEFKEGWVPDNYYGRYVVGRRKGAYGFISYQRALSKVLFDTNANPDIAYVVNERLFDANYKIQSTAAIEQLLFPERDSVVFKTEGSKQGNGIFFFYKEKFSLSAVMALGNGVFQSIVRQHSDLAQYEPGATSTIRITTIVSDTGTAYAAAAYLRVPRQGDSHVISSNCICVSINLTDGALNRVGYSPNWELRQTHPDSGVAFAGKYVPSFSKCVELACSLHEQYPLPECIGWDILVDMAGVPKVIEWNGEHNGIKFSEATTGPCFKRLNWSQLWQSPD